MANTSPTSHENLKIKPLPLRWGRVGVDQKGPSPHLNPPPQGGRRIFVVMFNVIRNSNSKIQGFCLEYLDFENSCLFRISPAFAEAASRRQVLRIYFPSSSSFLPASGKKSGDPNLSTPKLLMISCVSFETMKSAKAFPPGALTFGHLAGSTSMTW